MASYHSYGTMQRPATSTAPLQVDQPDDSKDSTRKRHNDFKLLCPFNIPLSPEAAAVRIIRNLGDFGLYYTLFVWIILFISLVPKRKVSLIFLVAMTVVTCLYLLLLRALPNSVVLQSYWQTIGASFASHRDRGWAHPDTRSHPSSCYFILWNTHHFGSCSFAGESWSFCGRGGLCCWGIGSLGGHENWWCWVSSLCVMEIERTVWKDI